MKLTIEQLQQLLNESTNPFVEAMAEEIMELRGRVHDLNEFIRGMEAGCKMLQQENEKLKSEKAS